MTSRAVRIGKRMPKNTKIRLFIILKNTSVLILLWEFIGISLLMLSLNNILKFASIKFDVFCNKCICCFVKPAEYLDSINKNAFVIIKNAGIFIILCVLTFIALFLLSINNILNLASNIVDFVYLKFIYCFSETLEYIDKKKYYNDSSRRIIYDRANKEPYLIRYYLLFTDRDKFPFNVFIHKFMRGDDDEDPHDHPWGFFHIILSGGYWEQVPVDEKDEPKFYKGFCKVWRKPGYWNIVNAKYTHRVELDDASPKPWTLFIPLIHNNYWGFWVKNNINVWSKINHEVYLKDKDKTSRENIKTE